MIGFGDCERNERSELDEEVSAAFMSCEWRRLAVSDELYFFTS